MKSIERAGTEIGPLLNTVWIRKRWERPAPVSNPSHGKGRWGREIVEGEESFFTCPISLKCPYKGLDRRVCGDAARTKRGNCQLTSLTKRQIEILTLLSKSPTPLTAVWLAKELGVSERTVRNEIKQMEKILKSEDIFIESIRGQGYVLKIPEQEKFAKIIRQNSHHASELADRFAEKEERVFYILKRFLLEKDFIKLENLSEEMYVSLSTLQNDLKEVKEILKKYDLTIRNRPHYGSKIEGDEYMKRLCLSNLILERNRILMNGDFLQFIDPDIFSQIKEILIKKVYKYKIEISDISLENLATHIAIACRRIQDGFVIRELANVAEEDHPFEKIVAREIIKEVENLTGLTFPKEEINYIIIHLLGTKLIQKKELIEFSKFDEVESIIKCMLDRLRTEFGWDFRHDHEFIQALILHIRPAMNRMRYKMNIRNPLLQDIKKKYPTAFEGAIVASRCIEEYLGMEVAEDEIAYIALHIGVALEKMKMKRKKVKKVLIVCASGVGSAKLLYYRLQNLFSQEIQIIDTINYYNLQSYDLSMIDFIISTVPIREDLGVPVLVVNTLLDDADVRSIRKVLSVNRKNWVKNYLDPKRIFLQKDFPDRDSVIRFLCSQLIRQNMVPEDYTHLVFERESVAPTSFGNLVAVPHPIKPSAKETFWTICTLKNPIKWSGDQFVQFVCLLNVNDADQSELDNMFHILLSIIDDKALVQKLIRCESAEELLQLFEMGNEL